MKRSRTLLESFMYAISGILYTLRTQRNIRIHFLTTILVLLLSWLMNLRALELLLVIVAITLVIVAEMINTAIETVVDMYTKEYHPLAEVAKNEGRGCINNRLKCYSDRLLCFFKKVANVIWVLKVIL